MRVNDAQLCGASASEGRYIHTSCPWLVLSFFQRHPIYYSQITKHGIAVGVCAVCARGTANLWACWEGL